MQIFGTRYKKDYDKTYKHTLIPSIMAIRGRNTVLGILQRKSDNKILIGFCERNNAGDSKVKESHTWKMPQGGIDSGEEPEITLSREIKEELNYELPSEFKKKALEETVPYYFFDEKEVPEFEVKLHSFLIKGEFPDEFDFDNEEFTGLKWIEPKEIYDLDLGIRKNAYIVILKKYDILD